ncbi:MAG TPA: DegT/DnrJ/EryC1/StrS family aminotransferase [Thermomicrobiales bacterium]|nr:DegT/DnrJ/EryC1/StrS family aminotransferase [Thermomicrobiales bacterium]
MTETQTTTRLAIEGGSPVRTTSFPAWPVFGDRERDLLNEVLESGHWGEITGDVTKTFARQFAAFQSARHAVCVPNGTLALELALETLGLGPGDEVITSAWTFIATAGAALTMGVRPIFVDIDPATNLIDPNAIERAITPKTRAIMPVHIGGQPTDLDAVMEIGVRHGIPVLEDACQAWGAAWRGTPVGAIGAMGAFSFQASKNINAGEGGAVVTNDLALFDLAWQIHDTGRSPEGGTFEHEIPGRNLRMTEWQGAILTAQLERLPEAMDRRGRSAGRLMDGLGEIPGLTPTKIDSRVTRHAWHLFQMRYDPLAFGGRSRAEFMSALQAEGVPCMPGYRPLPAQKAIRNALTARFGASALDRQAPIPHAEQAGEDTVWLEQTLLLGSDDDIDDALAACRKIHCAWSE